MKTARMISLLAIATLLVVAVASCSAGTQRRQGGEWTPAPISGTPAIGPAAPPLPTLAPAVGTAAQAPAIPPLAIATQAAVPTRVAPTVVAPTRAATATEAAAPQPTAVVPPATVDRNLVIITEGDVLTMVNSGGTAESGATLEGVGVDFTSDGRMVFSASRVGYGFVSADNVTIAGRLLAVDGRLEFQAESVSPRGIVTSMIPPIMNQMLHQYTSAWYIEEVRTLDGQLELRVR